MFVLIIYIPNVDFPICYCKNLRQIYGNKFSLGWGNKSNMKGVIYMKRLRTDGLKQDSWLRIDGFVADHFVV